MHILWYKNIERKASNYARSWCSSDGPSFQSVKSFKKEYRMDNNQVPASESTPAAAPTPVVVMDNPALATAVKLAAAGAIAEHFAAKELAAKKERAESVVKKYFTNPETGVELTVAWTLRIVLVAGIAMLALYAGDKFLKFVNSRKQAEDEASAAGAVLG
jgi:hypothetical protein